MAVKKRSRAQREGPRASVYLRAKSWLGSEGTEPWDTAGRRWGSMARMACHGRGEYRARMTRGIVVAFCLLPAAAGGAHLADHLVITEVGINVLTEPGGEFVEIMNPTDVAVSLDTYYLTDADDRYWNVVQGDVTLG